ncbi:MAG: hypothetical protein IBX52_08740 [Bacterioplanes sp.]|nr:hypothetical protein [Bacterioplanes sp.]
MDKDNNDAGIPGMKPSQDDIALRQKQLQRRTGSATAAKAATASANTTHTPTAKAPVGAAKKATPSSAWGAVTLVLVLVVGAVAGYALWQNQQLQQQLLNAQSIMQKQSDNLSTLNERLSATGENANLSVDALKVMLKDHDLEIRKLWDLANKRNRGNIASNESAISELKTSVVQLTRTQANQAAQQQKAVAELEQKWLTRLSADMDALSKRVTQAEAAAMNVPAAAELRMTQNSDAIRGLDGKIQRVEEQLGQGGVGRAELVNIKLEIEDIQIRLDRMQHALSAQ